MGLATVLALVGIGLMAGVFSGLFGVGGGVVVVPALILLLKVKHSEALGTSLAALVPPVGIFGALEYYRNGYVNIKYAALIALGLAIGAYVGARIVIGLPPGVVRRIYALFLFLLAIRLLLQKG